MNVKQFRDEIYRLTYTSEVNQRYYQIKHTRMWWADKAVKILVAFLAVTALLFVFLPENWKWLEIVTGCLAAAAAIMLNVVPVGEWMCDYKTMFDAWNRLFHDAEQLGLKVRDAAEDEPTPALLIEMADELTARQCHLDDAHAPDDKLLSECQGDVTQRMYGNGIRTYEQAIAEHERVNASC